MHDTAIANAKRFFECYGEAFSRAGAPVKIVEIGSQDVNGSLRSVAPPAFEYIGVDFATARGVDIVLDDPYVLPFADESVDIALSNSCLEHSELFWVSFLEVIRILKPGGLFYLNVPSNGAVHKYPVDCWRFYPDSGKALVAWAKRNGYQAGLLETYTSYQGANMWNDCVSVFLKDQERIGEFPRRIIDTFNGYDNGMRDGGDVLRPNVLTEDHRKLQVIGDVIAQKLRCK